MVRLEGTALLRGVVAQRVHVLRRMQEALDRRPADHRVAGPEQNGLAQLVVPGPKGERVALVAIEDQRAALEGVADTLEVGGAYGFANSRRTAAMPYGTAIRS